MAKYLIGDAARFDSDTLALESLQAPDVPLSLGAAAARCLLVLLEADGDIVTKKTLLAQAWEQYGAVVSANNLSQAIVQIRRALEQASVDPAVLVTVPRIGYRLNQVVRVSPFVDANTAPSVVPASPVLPMPHFGRENAQSDADEKEISSAAEAQASNVAAGIPATSPPVSLSVRAVSRFTVRPLMATAIWASIALISTLAAFQVIPPLRGDLRTNARAAVWLPVDGDDTHRYFITPERARDAAFIADRIATLHREPPVSVGDLDTRRVYMNDTAHGDTSSYILCRYAIEEHAPDCVSYLIVNQQAAHASS
ncbi:hypothetical protein PIN31009_04352 [Pandoraea iniqua]|uniref:transcriptional regulator n=1 Tax=Pandoraea iniqua TaxID=2508288 RepID=UPI001255293A|nr:winged helix-turn-helix domain-containing protein [Pandoraea iniqua]VVE45603.1 hypothetical protein PIN31009_04352 [Pandoraea iniqua]